MITLRDNGTAHMARIEVCVVDGHVQATGSPGLVRTKNLRRDPRCSLFIFGPHPTWLGLETTATILEGNIGAALISLHRARHPNSPTGTVIAHDDELGHDRPYSEEEFLAHASAEHLFIYQFEINRTYGNHSS